MINMGWHTTTSFNHRVGLAIISIVGLLFLSVSCSLLQGTDGAGDADSDQSSLTYVPATSMPSLSSQLANPDPPEEPVKLIFIHHSVGAGWLEDGNGSLGLALRDNNYFVSDTNYGWGPDNIGDHTDIGDWLDWFRGSKSDRYLEALYAANENYTGNYGRIENPDPDRENEVILFKSCFPNSNLKGDPEDLPKRGSASSVGGAKYVYEDLLNYFAMQQDKLFVIITAPPVTEENSNKPPENARAFNNWLVNDWLLEYPFDNVAVFDFYNVLTSNDGDIHVNDLGNPSGNHHRWWEGEMQDIQMVDNDLAAYPTGDSHPNYIGNQKATAEFIPLLNAYYHRWRGDMANQ
jgi:hypothetical protein